MVETRVSAVVDNRTGGIFRQDLVAAVSSSSSSACNAAAANQRSHQTAQSSSTFQSDTDWRIDSVHVASRWQIRRIL